MSKIVVVGSASIDFNVVAPRLPERGETVLGSRFFQVCGGKGANQAVGCARLGASTAMLLRIGDDAAGRTIREGLRSNGVDDACVTVDPEAASGTAHITIAQSGDNAIVVVPGSNDCLSPDDVDRFQAVIAGAQVVMLQLEIPPATALHALEVARKYGVATILDPAPAPASPLPPAFYPLCTWITPNETEAAALCGFAIQGPADAARAVRLLAERGVTSPIVKLGGGGAVYRTPDGEIRHLPAFAVKVVDTTAAGDAFAAGLAVGLTEGLAGSALLRFASATGALAVTRYGAQPSLPSRAELEQLLAQSAPGPEAVLS